MIKQVIFPTSGKHRLPGTSPLTITGHALPGESPSVSFDDTGAAAERVSKVFSSIDAHFSPEQRACDGRVEVVGRDGQVETAGCGAGIFITSRTVSLECPVGEMHCAAQMTSHVFSQLLPS